MINSGVAKGGMGGGGGGGGLDPLTFLQNKLSNSSRTEDKLGRRGRGGGGVLVTCKFREKLVT